MEKSGNLKIENMNYLRTINHSPAIPFTIEIASEGGVHPLICKDILRILPGKRLVCSGEWNDLNVVVKFFLDQRRGKRHFRREERGVIALRKSGVMTPIMLFSGSAVSENIPVLGFEMIKESEDLGKVWDNAQSHDLRLSLLNLLVSVLAKQHKAGLIQKDPHLRNFLLSGVDIYAIDGDAVDVRHMGEPLSYKKSFKNLGLFFAQFYPVYGKLIPDAFKSYARERGWISTDTLYDCLMKEVIKCRYRSEVIYLNKIFRENTAFTCRRSLTRFMVCGRTYYDEAMAAFLNDPDAMLKDGKMLKDGNSSTVFIVRLSGRALVIKRYNIKNMWHALRRSFRQSRAWVSWRNAHLLKIIGVNTPNPVAMVENRLGPLRRVSYILSEYVDGTDIHHLLNSDKAGEVDIPGMARQFGEILRKFSSSSVSHGDFKATNFILSDNRLFITDLDAVCKHRLRSRFKKAFMKDLERFMRNWKKLPYIATIFQNEISKIKF